MAKKATKKAEFVSGITLADGTFLHADAGYANGDLWVWMRDSEDNDNDTAYLFGLFIDPEKTAKIRYDITKDVFEEWEGFTKLTTVNIDVDGINHIRMRKE